MPRFLIVVAAVGGLCGVAALLLGVLALPMGLPAPLLAERLYSQVSLHLWFVEILLIVVAVGAAAFGLVGYQSIREAATVMARAEARRVVAAHMLDYRESLHQGLDQEETNDEKAAGEHS